MQTGWRAVLRAILRLVAVSVGCFAIVAPATAAASTFSRVLAHTAGDSLEIDFVEHGLAAGQNYAYTGSAGTVVETFQCYRSSTFTPLQRTFTVKATTTTPDVRGYTANANGVVRGFIFLEPVLPPFRGCRSPRQETVPIFVSYTDYELVNIFTFDFVDVSGTVSGPIEPD